MDIFYPFQLFADVFTYQVLGIAQYSYMGKAVHFFVYDSLKILLLLLAINYLMAVIRYYLPIDSIRDFLTKRNWYGFDYIFAALFGVLTPFCSCSSIPLFVGFLSAGVPLGVTLSFLITSPLVNEASIAMFIGLFGWKVTVLYVLAGMSVGVIGGMVLSRLRLERFIDNGMQDIIARKRVKAQSTKADRLTLALLKQFWHEGWSLTRKIFGYVLVGVGIGSFIHGFVPVGFFESSLQGAGVWSVPVATLIAIPLYSNAVSIIPIMQALVAKGVSFGTALAFMMATVGLSLPEALILKKVMKLPLLVSFFSVVALGIIIIGYVFNAFMP